MKKDQWYISVAMAALPLMVRSFVALMHTNRSWEFVFNVLDITVFSLVLFLSNIIEAMNVDTKKDSYVPDKANPKDKYKTRAIALSLLFIVFVSLVYFGALYKELDGAMPAKEGALDMIVVQCLAAALACTSLVMSYRTHKNLEIF